MKPKPKHKFTAKELWNATRKWALRTNHEVVPFKSWRDAGKLARAHTQFVADYINSKI